MFPYSSDYLMKLLYHKYEDTPVNLFDLPQSILLHPVVALQISLIFFSFVRFSPFKKGEWALRLNAGLLQLVFLVTVIMREFRTTGPGQRVRESSPPADMLCRDMGARGGL